jgi:hypothetical protein
MIQGDYRYNPGENDSLDWFYRIVQENYKNFR